MIKLECINCHLMKMNMFERVEIHLLSLANMYKIESSEL